MKPPFLDSDQRLTALRAIFDATDRDNKLEADAALELIRKLHIFGEPEEPIEPLSLLNSGKLLDALATFNHRGIGREVATICYKVGLATHINLEKLS